MIKKPTKQSSFVDFVVTDVLSEINGISHRAMFGGYGIYKNGIIFAIIANDNLYFKIDDSTLQDYKKRGSQPFVYVVKGKKNTMSSYWELPAEILEDNQAVKTWAQKAYLVSKKSKKKQ